MTFELFAFPNMEGAGGGKGAGARAEAEVNGDS